MNHKRKRSKSQRAACWCKPGKKGGSSALRGPQRFANMGARDDTKGGAGARLRLRERALDES